MVPSKILNTALIADTEPLPVKSLPILSAKPIRDDKNPGLLHRSLIERPHRVVHASGSYLTLEGGRRILDACGGAAVSIIGHGNAEVKEAIIAQLDSAAYVHTLTYTTDASEDLADFLLHDPTSTFKHDLEKAYFVGSGSEANDAAMKMARQYFFDQGQTERKYFVARRQAYHGNTIGALSISSNLPRKVPYNGAMTLPNVSHVSPAYFYQYGHPGETEQAYTARLLEELETEFLRLGPENVIAFFAEPVVGATTGCVPAPVGYFKGVRAITEKYGILLVLDEIMCGMGRTGTMFAFEQEDIVPDIVSMGKGLGGGYAPIAAILVGKKIIDVLRRGSNAFNHGHTYQAHPVSCAGALAVQSIVRRDKLVANCAQMGLKLEIMLRESLKDCKYVGDIRGRGLFWGVEFVKDKKTKACLPQSIGFGVKIQQACFERGVALYPGSTTKDGFEGDHVIIAPPYNVSEEELETVVKTLKEAYLSLEAVVDGL